MNEKELEPTRSELEAIVAAGDRDLRVSPKQASDPGRLAPDDRARPVLEALEGLDGFDALQSAAETQVRLDSDRLRAQAEASRERSAQVAGRSQVAIGNWADRHRELFEELPPEPDGISPVIATPTSVKFIRTSPGGALHSFDEQNAWAKWETRLPGPGFATSNTFLGPEHAKVSFFHLWRNTVNRRVLVDVQVAMTAVGHLAGDADGGGFGGLFAPASGGVSLRAELSLWPLWNPGAVLTYDTKEMGGTTAVGGFFGDSSSRSIVEGETLSATRFFVGARAWVLIEVSLVAEFDCFNGSAVADFASADAYRVGCPYCFVIAPG
jgi:hypothetical protein